MKRLERGDHLFEMIDVLAMDDEVGGEGDATLAGLMFANPSGQFDFVRVGARSGDPVRVAFGRILKAELNMVEARIHELRQPLARRARCPM